MSFPARRGGGRDSGSNILLVDLAQFVLHLKSGLNPPDSQKHSRDKLASGSQWEGRESPWIQPQYVTRKFNGSIKIE